MIARAKAAHKEARKKQALEIKILTSRPYALNIFQGIFAKPVPVAASERMGGTPPCEGISQNGISPKGSKSVMAERISEFLFHKQQSSQRTSKLSTQSIP